MKYLLLVCAAATIVSCSSVRPPAKVGGFRGELTLTDGSRHEVELLALSDKLTVATRDSVWIVAEPHIVDLRVDVHTDRGGWTAAMLATIGVPSLTIIVRSQLQDYREGTVIIGAIGLGISAAVFAGYVGSEPTSFFRWPLITDQFRELRTYMRYPFGLTPELLDRLRTQMPVREW